MIKNMIVIITGIIAAIYLINPTAGIIELLPDNLPVLGNMDEAVAVGILMNTFAYYGIDLTNLYGKKNEKKKVRRIVRTTDGKILEDKIVDADEDMS